MTIEEFGKERDKAFIDFVKTGNTKKFHAYCKKYKVPIPKNPLVMEVGIYRAVQYCTNISVDIKALAMLKCLEIGFSPFIEGVTDGME